MPKSKRGPGGKEAVGQTIDTDIEDIDFGADADITEEQAQERRDALKERSPASASPTKEGTLYVERRGVFTAEGSDGDEVKVRDETTMKTKTMSRQEFNAKYEELNPEPKVPRWKIQLQDPSQVPRSLWGATGPDIAKIYAYVDRGFEANGKIPSVPGVMISGPAC